MDKITYIRIELRAKKYDRKDINDFFFMLSKLKLYTLYDIIDRENDVTLILHKEDQESNEGGEE